jgi:hypothetical protein
MVFALVTVFFAHILFGPSFYFWIWPAIIPGIYLAVAGKGNRVFFSALLALVNVIAFVGIAMLKIDIDIDKLGVVGGLLVCILFVLWPALLLWLAHTLNIRQRKR